MRKEKEWSCCDKGWVDYDSCESRITCLFAMFGHVDGLTKDNQFFSVRIQILIISQSILILTFLGIVSALIRTVANRRRLFKCAQQGKKLGDSFTFREKNYCPNTPKKEGMMRDIFCSLEDDCFFPCASTGHRCRCGIDGDRESCQGKSCFLLFCTESSRRKVAKLQESSAYFRLAGA